MRICVKALAKVGHPKPRTKDRSIPVLAGGQVSLQITGRLTVRPGQAKVRLAWAL